MRIYKAIEGRDNIERPGVYIVIDTDSKVLYVGKSMNIENRLYFQNHHIINNYSYRIDSIHTWVIENDNSESDRIISRVISSLEAGLIRLYKPELNKMPARVDPYRNTKIEDIDDYYIYIDIILDAIVNEEALEVTSKKYNISQSYAVKISKVYFRLQSEIFIDIIEDNMCMVANKEIIKNRLYWSNKKLKQKKKKT